MMKQWKFMKYIPLILLAAALLFSSAYAQEEIDPDEPVETAPLVVNSANPDGFAEYIYVLDEDQPGVDVTADGADVSAIVPGDVYSVFGGVDVLTANGRSAGLDLGSVRGGYGMWLYLNTGSVQAAVDSITASDGAGIDVVTEGAAVLDLTAAQVSSSSYGVTIQTSAESINYDDDGDFIDPGDPDDWTEIEEDIWYEIDGELLSPEIIADETAENVSGGANITLTLGSIEAEEAAAVIDINQNDTVTLTAEDYISSNTAALQLNLFGEGGSAVITAPVIDAGEQGLDIYAADGSVNITAEEHISADSAVELTNDGADITLKSGYLEGSSGLFIEATDGTTTAETKDITAENYGVSVWTYNPEEYEEYDPGNTDDSSSAESAAAAAGSPAVKITVDGDITDYIDYQPEGGPDTIDPIIPEESESLPKAADDGNEEGSDEQGSVGIVVAAETESAIDITVNGVIEMAYGNEIAAENGSAVKVSVTDDVSTDYGSRIAAYDGAAVSFDFGGDINAGGKALDTAAYSGVLDISVAGDINVMEGNDDDETAGIYANSAGIGKTDISVEGRITVDSQNANPAYGLSLENTGGTMNVKVAGDVSVSGSDAVGLDIINSTENDLADFYSADEEITTNVEILGSVTGSTGGVNFDTDEGLENAKAFVLVTDTISGGVILSEETSADNFDLAVWKIDPSNTSGNAAVTPDGTPSPFAPEIKYIVKIKPEDVDKIKAVDENGDPLPTVNGPVTGDAYPYQTEGKRVYLEGINGYDLTEAHNGKDAQTVLRQDKNGRFYLDVPASGGVWLSVEKNPTPVPPVPPVPPEPYPDFRWLCGIELPHTGFSASHAAPLAVRPHGLVYRTTGLTLQIPRLDVSEQIVTVPAAEDGSYPVEWLENAVGLLEQSSLPGKGVTVLTGHNHLNMTEAGPFLFLSTLEDGDTIMINDRHDRMMIYRVTGSYKIASDGFASITDNLKENSLVLITCEDESPDGGYLNRRVVFAEPM